MSHLKSELPQIGRECSSLKVYEGVFRYKIVCILQYLLGTHSRICIPCDKGFLALRRQRKIRHHVSARFDGDVGIMIMGQEKQPFEELEARKSYELVLITHNGSASKFRIVTEWTDSSGNQHTKTQMGDFS